MREHRDPRFRSPVRESDEPNKKCFLVYEGTETERIYFNSIIQNRDSIGVNKIIELIPVTRCYTEQPWSNPKKITEA